jgi:hypothetical protein
MLIHALLSWPEIITKNLWPFALQYAIDLHNSAPSSTVLSPIDIFSATKHATLIHDFHTFGFPICIRAYSQAKSQNTTLETTVQSWRAHWFFTPPCFKRSLSSKYYIRAY